MLNGTFRPFDLHKGRPAWVLGGGPSLLEQDPAEVVRAQSEGAVVLGVNHHLRLTEIGFPVPDYWLGLDLGLMELHPELFVPVPRWPRPVKLFPRNLCQWLEARGYFYGGDGRGMNFYTIGVIHNTKPERKTDLLGCAISTVGAAIHLAVVMGCEDIHVRGLDLKRDALGRICWYSEPEPAKAHADDEAYAGQGDDLHCMVQHFKQMGLRLDVRGASWLCDRPYVPLLERQIAGHIESLDKVRVVGAGT